MRAPFQVLIIPFVKEEGKYYYAVFRRKDLGIWQFLAGGGEDSETPVEAMKREAEEEASIDRNAPYIKLANINTIPAANIRGLEWGEEVVMIPEFAFGVELPSKDIKLSNEHIECLWLDCEEAMEKLKYDSNKSAVWELDYRLKNNKIEGVEKNLQTIKKYL
jgi:dATP pyrophosphohydrolase